MYCPLYKLNPTDLTKKMVCDEVDCGWWDKKKDQCGVLSYMQAYFSMGLATLKMTETIERFERENGEEEEEVG